MKHTDVRAGSRAATYAINIARLDANWHVTPSTDFERLFKIVYSETVLTRLRGRDQLPRNLRRHVNTQDNGDDYETEWEPRAQRKFYAQSLTLAKA